MKLISMVILAMLFGAGNLKAQANTEESTSTTREEKGELLLTPTFAFSHQKTAYITLMDGKELKGTIDDIDRNKGLIEQIKVKDESGKKVKLKPEQVKFMYLPPSGLNKLAKAVDVIYDAKKWNSQRLNQDLIKQGYVYFELAKVRVKKSTEMLLVQLLNPSFSDKIKVYHDPRAKETASVGIGGISVAGGIAKSYYVLKNADDAAYKLTKSDYQKQFASFWAGSDDILKKYPEGKWRDFTDHIHMYNKL